MATCGGQAGEGGEERVLLHRHRRRDITMTPEEIVYRVVFTTDRQTDRQHHRETCLAEDAFASCLY